jgi:hypothetical protein
MDGELRAAKEAFVSGLPGTTKWEIFCLVACLPFTFLSGAPPRCEAPTPAGAPPPPLTLGCGLRDCLQR